MVYDSGNNVHNGSDSEQLYFRDKVRLLGVNIRNRLRYKTKGIRNTDRELYGGSIILKNLAIVRKEQPMSAEYIFESLMENSQNLKPLYQELITNYRAGRDKEAFETFGQKTGSKNGKHFAMILSKLDKINPWELMEQMDVFQSMMAEERMTKAMKEVEKASIIGTAWSTAAVLTILINFTIVIVFLDMITELNNLF